MSTRNERLADTFRSLDQMLEGVDATKAPILSDKVAGAERIVGASDRSPDEEREYLSSYNRKIHAAQMRLYRANLGYAVPTLMCIIRNGRRYGDSVREIAASRLIDHGASKTLCFFTPKKLKKVISANKIKGFPHAARPKKAVFGLPERAWTYRGHI